MPGPTTHTTTELYGFPCYLKHVQNVQLVLQGRCGYSEARAFDTRSSNITVLLKKQAPYAGVLPLNAGPHRKDKICEPPPDEADVPLLERVSGTIRTPGGKEPNHRTHKHTTFELVFLLRHGARVPFAQPPHADVSAIPRNNCNLRRIRK